MTGALILAIGGWTAFACMTAVASVLAIILRDRERQVAHLKRCLHQAQAQIDQQWEGKGK